MKLISVDYDGTLSKKEVQDYVRVLIDLGVEVQITTARTIYTNYLYEGHPISSKDWNGDLFKVSDSLGIPRDKVIFCDNGNKSDFINKEVTFHLDDDELELMNLLDNNRYIGIDVNNPRWRELCNKRLNPLR